MQRKVANENLMGEYGSASEFYLQQNNIEFTTDLSDDQFKWLQSRKELESAHFDEPHP